MYGGVGGVEPRGFPLSRFCAENAWRLEGEVLAKRGLREAWSSGEGKWTKNRIRGARRRMSWEVMTKTSYINGAGRRPGGLALEAANLPREICRPSGSGMAGGNRLALQAPNCDRTLAWLRILPEQPLPPRHARTQVENHQVPCFRPASVHVGGRLLQPLPDQTV